MNETIDHAQHLARHLVTRAIDDEIEHCGEARISATLCCFLEHRIAEFIRQHSHLPGGGSCARFDA